MSLLFKHDLPLQLSITRGNCQTTFTINPKRKATVQAPQAFNSQDSNKDGFWSWYVMVCSLKKLDNSFWNFHWHEICRDPGVMKSQQLIHHSDRCQLRLRSQEIDRQRGESHGYKQQRFLRQDLWRSFCWGNISRCSNVAPQELLIF